MTRIPLLPHNKSIKGSAHQWYPIPQQLFSNFIEELNSDSDGKKKTASDFAQVVSGVPTPFARVEITRQAFQAGDTKNALKGIYEQILSEWKGLLTLLCLQETKLKIDKIVLAPSDEFQQDFEIKKVLGEMLFEDSKPWQEGTGEPRIHVISYLDDAGGSVVIGGTSPYSLLFSAPDYNLQEDFSYCSADGKLQDPLQHPNKDLNEEELQQLFSYVKYLRNYTVNKFLEEAHEDVSNLIDIFSHFLAAWLGEMREYAKAKGYKLEENAIVNPINLFESGSWYAQLFNAETELYSHKGKFYTKAKLGNGVGAIKVGNQNELLLDAKQHSLVAIDSEQLIEEKKRALHLLKAYDGSGKAHFFSLPLSADGLKHFKDSLEKLLDTKDDSYSTLSASYDTKNAILTVELSILIDVNSKTTLKRSYKLPESTDERYLVSSKKDHKAILWPNFISEHWSRYYLYSEILQDSGTFHSLHPLIGEELEPLEKNKGLIVSSDGAGGLSLIYEIYESSVPFKGLAIKAAGKDKQLGYLIFRATELTGGSELKIKNSAPTAPAKIGFDFGSNNISIACSSNGENDKIQFKNRRVMLLGKEEDENTYASANRLFFFPMRSNDSGQLRSYVIEHRAERIVQARTNKAIQKGIPVLERNLHIDDYGSIPQPELRLDLDGEVNSIHYDLKWKQDMKVNENRRALIRTLWIMVCAELFDKGAFAQQLNWAYPSAMPSTLKQQFKMAWNELSNIQCLSDPTKFPLTVSPHGKTESEAVCAFTLSSTGQSNIGISGSQIFLGLDVGGSTTDLLIIGLDEHNNDALIRQSSILASASYLIQASQVDNKVVEALKEYVDGYENIQIKGIENVTKDSVHYFLNLLFDELEDNKLDHFYNFLFAKQCYKTHAAAAYISGLLLFYSGIILSKVLGEDLYTNVTTISLGFYGKGGRIFDWPKALEGGDSFLEDCIKEGLTAWNPEDKEWADRISKLHIQLNKATNHETTKMEVALGLCHDNVDIVQKPDSISEVIGEKGFYMETEQGKKELDVLDPISSEQLEKFRKKFFPPKQFEVLSLYANLFKKFAAPLNLADSEAIDNYLDNPTGSFINFVKNHVEYIKAKKSASGFQFESPMIVLAGLSLFEQVFDV